jgi:predicted  nucleic acid-binding Zn-ribbon protein
MSYRDAIDHYTRQRALESLTYRIGVLERDLNELQSLVLDLQDMVQHLFNQQEAQK